MSNFSFSCPLCQKPLTEQGNSFLCENRHCFDKAKSGYVNLLADGNKNSKLPGDNKLMVNARRDFLNKDYYKPLATALCRSLAKHLSSISSPTILDAGCGEGYYTDLVAQSLLSANIFGIDISKFALNSAAKKNKRVHYGVGSIFHLPMPNHSCDAVLNLFAPFCGEEFVRVLKPNGLLFVVIPDKRHLWELKEAVYDIPYENEPKDPTLPDFTLLETVQIRDRISLSSNEDIENLFTMTPYYYKTSAENFARLHKLTTLDTAIEFELFIYQVNA